MKILHVEPEAYPEEAKRLLETVGEVVYRSCLGQDEFLRCLAGADYEAVFLRLGIVLDCEALDAARALRVVVTPTTGLNHIDLERAGRRGVRVINLRGETDFLREIRSTAEHAWGLLLALVRRIPWGYADVLDGQWRRVPWRGRELAGRTLGVIGYGRLGKLVAGYGLAFGMRVLVHDVSEAALVERPGGIEVVSLDWLLAKSDFVSIHLPLERSTECFMSENRLRAMRPRAVLVNTARGELIDERALLVVLEDGHLAGAALDVLAGDAGWDGVLPTGKQLVEYARRHSNVLITPHIGGYTEEAIAKTRLFISHRFVDLVRSGSIQVGPPLGSVSNGG